MKIIILGAGQVGASVARNLAGDHDITVVDNNAKVLQELQTSVDLRTITGHASHPEMLQQAGADDADMLLAVTSSDETNMLACQIAYNLFNTPTKIARVRQPEYLKHPRLFGPDALHVDLLISPEALVTRYIQRLIDYPEALQVLDFADSKVQLVAIQASAQSPLIGHPLFKLHEDIPGAESHIAAIYRQDRAIIPQQDDLIQCDDEVFFMAGSKHVSAVMTELGAEDRPAKRVIIGGGGNVGTRLAKTLEHDHHVKIIEFSRTRAQQISLALDKSIVLEGSVTDEKLLEEANIDGADVYCALTHNDELNILSAMLAKRLGVRKTMAIVNNVAYVDLVENSPIDIAIFPQQATIGALLAHVRRGDVVMVHTLRRGAAEAIEAIAHGDPNSSKVVGRTVEEVKLPPGATIGAIVRGEKIIMKDRNTAIEAGDHIILFLADRSRIREVESLFQVGFSFF